MLKRIIAVCFSICLLLCLSAQISVPEVRASGAITTTVDGLVLDDPAEYSSEAAYVEASLAKMLEFLDLDDSPDWFKVLRVHDFVCEFLTYDIDFQEPGMCSVFTSGHGVCEHYTQLTHLLLTGLGIDSGYIVCLPMDHAWNIVEVQGKWYNLDTTWDDNDDSGIPEYDYFLKCDESFAHGRGQLGEEAYNGETYAPYQNGYAGILISETDFHCGSFGDDLYWAISEDDTLTFYGSGSVISLGCTAADLVRRAVLPEGITTIGRQYADDHVGFGGCDSLTEVHLPASLTYIGTDSFLECYSLTDVYYAGSEAQWNAIEILSGNEELLNARIHFAIPSGEWETRSGICGDDLSWTLAEDHVLRITGTGDMYDYGPGEAPWHDYVSHIYDLEIDEGVSGIGSYAFDDCLRIVDPVIPASVARFGDYAFSDCIGLRSFTIPNSVSQVGEGAFYGCARLRNVSLTANITRLSDKMFYGCERLQQVVIPDGIRSIGDHCFYGCTCLSVKPLPESLTSIGEYAFAYCTVMDEVVTSPNVTQIAAGTFYGCSGLSTVHIPEYITSIGEYAFAQCDGLDTLVFHGAPLSIGDHAFSDCGYMEHLDLAGVTAIGEGSFSGCCGLETIAIPDTVTSIGANAFMNCSALRSIVIPGSVEHVGGYAFQYCTDLGSVILEEGVASVGEYAFAYCTGLTEILLPDSLGCIGAGAFGSCHSLEHIILPDNITTLGDGLFAGCPLKSITIPGSVKHLPAATFSNCRTLETVVLKDGIVSIGQNAFGQCPNLTSIEMPDTLTRIDSKAFSSCPGLKSISIPCGVSTIGDHAFLGCSLADVYYGGNETLWDRIRIGSQNDALTAATMHFAEIPEGQEGICNMTPSVYWSLTDGGQLIIYGEGEANVCGWNDFRDEITSITILPGVTAVSGGIFRDLTNLTAVQIPDTVTALDTFGGCSGLTAIVIPDSVRELGSYTFSGCSGLRDVTLPAGLPCIPEGMFSDCTALEEFVVPEQAAGIGSFAFSGCTGLREIQLPSGLTAMNEGAFFNCSSLRNIAIPSGVTEIETLVFYGCSGLTGIEFPENVTTIGADVFSDRDNLTSVILPAALTSVGEYSFGMDALVDVYYVGSADEWAQISIADGNHRLKIADIHYNCDQHLEAIREEDPVSATCKADGGYDVVTYCTVCTRELRREHVVLPAAGHDHTAVVTAPTCMTGGYTTYTCTTCGDHYVGAQTKARGHSYDAAATTEPSCNRNGYTTYICSECGDQCLSDYVLGGHRYEISSEGPTCTERGHTTYICSCGRRYEDDYVDALGHDYADGACTRCGAEDPDFQKPGENPFTDVPEGSFYYTPVIWALENGITSGATADSFDPTGNCQRAQVVTFLWRAAGKPEPASSVNPFVDVKETDFYYKAVLWAVEQGITNGLDAAHFGPFALCNRAQVVTFLYRAMGNPAVSAIDCPFADVDAGAWYEVPILWAVENDITNGIGGDLFGVDAICNRAQVVTFLYRTYVK